MEYYEIKQEMIQHLQNCLDYGRDFTDEEIEEVIDELLVSQEKMKLLSVQERRTLRKELFDRLRGLDILQKYLEDEDITEIMINGENCIFVEKKGLLCKAELQFESQERLIDIIQKIAGECNRIVNEATPIADARLKDGSRVNIVMAPVSLDGPAVTIRKFPKEPITMEYLIENRSISEEAAELLCDMVRKKRNIFISGGTGSGKTTFLNVLSNAIPKSERVITIEDSAELQLQGLDNLIRLETRNSNLEGTGEITIRDLIKASLRMRPDRIIVGEIRGKEAFDMLQAMNTGHEGSMCTGHSNSARDMLTRIENMVLMGMELPIAAIRQQIVAGLDYIVHLGRLRDGSRKIMEISQVQGMAEGEIVLKPLYVFQEAAGCLVQSDCT